MSRQPRRVSDGDAREITEFLLNKGIPQKEIAPVVKRSQPWVSGVKRERDLVASAREKGRQEFQDEIIRNVEDKTARELSRRMLQRPNIPELEE